MKKIVFSMLFAYAFICIIGSINVFANETIQLNSISNKLPGDEVTITGTTNREVTVKVIRPNQTVLYVDVLKDKAFQHTFKLPSDSMLGEYTVIVGDNAITVKRTFIVQNYTPSYPSSDDTTTPTTTPPSPTQVKKMIEDALNEKLTIEEIIKVVDSYDQMDDIDSELLEKLDTEILKKTKAEIKVDAITETEIKGLGLLVTPSDISSNIHIKFDLQVQSIDDSIKEPAKVKIDKLAENNHEQIGKYLDITLNKNINNKKVVVENTFNNYITITIKIPLEILGYREYKIIREHKGKAEYLPTQYDQKLNTLTFKTNKFSEYAITYSGSKAYKPYITGYNGTFQPDGKLTRAQAMAMFSRLSEDFIEGKDYKSNFTDVNEGSWAKDYIGYMEGKGIINGKSSDIFDETGYITRAEFAKVLSLYKGLPLKEVEKQTFNDTKEHWASKYIEACVLEKLVNGYGDGTFRPDAFMTKAEAVKMLNHVINKIPNEDKIDKAIESGTQVNPFKDVTTKHWAYYHIIEAISSDFVQ